MADRYVLAFVGENAHGILQWLTEQILLGLGKFGFDSELINLRDPDHVARLNGVLQARRPTFCYSTQAIGMDVRTGGENIWVKNKIPFLSHLGDNPYHCPRLHTASGPGMYRLNASADFLSTYTKYFRGGAISTLQPSGFPENPDADKVPWAKREHGLIYVKTGVNPETFRQRWAAMPPLLRAVAHDSAAAALAGSDAIIADICAGCFEANNLFWGGRNELFFAICSQVDFYVRAVRAERMVRFLMQQPSALIFGEWDYLDRTGARARFCGTTAAGNLNGLYANSKVLVSTSPSIRHGIHERILAGLHAGCMVLSDRTPHLSAFFADMPAFLGVDIDDPRFEQQAADTLSLYTNCEAITATSLTVTRDRLSLDRFIGALLELLDVERWRTLTEPYHFDG